MFHIVRNYDMTSNYRPTVFKIQKGTERENGIAKVANEDRKNRRALPINMLQGNVIDIGFYHTQWKEESQKISMNDEEFAAFLLQFCNYVSRGEVGKEYKQHLFDFIATYKENKESRIRDCIPKLPDDEETLITIGKYYNLWKERKRILDMSDEEFAGYLLHLWRFSSNPFSDCATELEIDGDTVSLNNKAFVTVATNDSYAMGALVLGYSLRHVETKFKLVVLVTPDVSPSVRTKLKNIFDDLREVDLLDSKDEANLSLMERPELGQTFTKLHIWKLEQYSKCVFLDADTLVCKNCDELFEREELSAAPDIGWPDCFNSGVFVFVPSQDTFHKLLNFAVEKGSFDGGDQGLLNAYFCDWASKDIKKHLSFIYNMVTSCSYTYVPAYKHYGHNVKIIHFLGAMKPWMHDHRDILGGFDSCETCHHSAEYYKLWWDIYSKHTTEPSSIEEKISEDLGNLSLDKQPSPTSPERSPIPSTADRQSSWEQGQIDYLGADSFDNIQRKLEEAINDTKK